MSNALWVGVLVGVPVGAFAPGWAKIVVFLVALLFSDLVHGALHNVHNIHNVHFAVPPWLIGVGGVAFGLWSWHYARRRGLWGARTLLLALTWASMRLAGIR
jgi:hypothetical protein